MCVLKICKFELCVPSQTQYQVVLCAFKTGLFPQMGFMIQVWFAPCLQGTILQQ